MKKTCLCLVGAMLILALLAGCGSNTNEGPAASNGNASPTSSASPSASPNASPSESASSSPAAAESSAFPKKIVHAKGEITLETKPAKVAVTYFPYAEHLFAIGDEASVAGVVGLKSLQNFPVYDPYVEDGRIADLGDEADLEKIAAAQPDVIVASEYDDKIYDQLAKIAPTIVIPTSENWQDTIGKVADIVGDEAKAQAYIEAYDAKLEGLAAKLDNDGLKGKTALFMMTWGKGFNYYYGKRLEPYYKGLGFSGFENQKDYGEISLEGVSEWNPDYIFLAEDFTNSAELNAEALKSNAVWNSLNAVKNGHVYVVDSEIVGPLAMGQNKGLDYMAEVFGKK